jgi:CDP-diacylglycerol--serine O-phosphatidyltransferase
VVAALLTALIGILMIANMPYYSFKTIDQGGRVPFAAVILVVLIFGMVTIDPPRVLLGAFLLYAISGPVVRVVRGNKASD